MTTESPRCYWVEAPGRGSLREEPLATPAHDEVIVRAEFSGISPGTERLVGLGLVPQSCRAAMTCQGMKGSFALPVAYGYSLVGTVDGGARDTERVFAMHPHQDRAVIAQQCLVSLPDPIPSARATLLPNVETALNAVWDAELSGGERVTIIGAGAVGSLVAFVLSHLHREPPTVVDADAQRVSQAGQLPWVEHATGPDGIGPGGCDVAFHATGNGAGLQLALDAVGFEGRVVDLSWYGDQPIALRLGDSFHHQRKRIVASQVAHVAPSHRAAGRLARTSAVLELLGDDRLDALLGTPVPFADLPAFFAALYDSRGNDICPLVSYQTKS